MSLLIQKGVRMYRGIIFLDIDGVLKHPFENNWYNDSIELINNYCNSSNIKIVISSEWRLHKSRAFFNKILSNNVIGMTKDLSSIHCNYTRYYECIQYASKHKINNFLFIDDKPSLFLNTDKLIVTNPDRGITFNDIFLIDLKFSKSLEFKQMSIFNNTEEITYWYFSLFLL